MAARVSSWVLLFLLFLAGAALEVRAIAQEATVSPASSAPLAATAAGLDTTVGAALRSLTSRASVVFVGQVAAVERKGGVVEITFNVQQGVAGNVGATYMLREWAGLWAGGQQRYWPGQRAMFFLRAPKGVAGGGPGLSSPVDGMEGVVPLVPTGVDAAPLLDVRRLATRVLRAQGQPMTGEAVALPDAARLVAAWRSGTASGPALEPALTALPQGVKAAAVGGHDGRQ